MSEKNGTAMVVHAEHSAALAAPGDFGEEHMRIVREALAPTASQAEFEVMWAGAKSRGLDPVKKQIHFVKRRTKRDGEWVDVWTSIVGIDGFRSIAESTGKYDGQDEPEYEYTADDRIVLARVKVYRKDISRPFVGVARWMEYVQTDRDGNPNATWGKMEHTMLAKCAEALALRKAFPEKLGGLYTGEEMAQAENETPAREWRVTAAKPELPPVAPPSPSKPSAADLLHRLDGASRDAAREVLRAAATMPKVRAHAWRKILNMAADVSDVEAIVAEMKADSLPEEILVKLLTEAESVVEKMHESDAGDTGDDAGGAK